jgi:hypothetical protein
MMLSELYHIVQQIKHTSSRATKKAFVASLGDTERSFLAVDFELNAIGPETLSYIIEDDGFDVPVGILLNLLNRMSETASRNDKEFSAAQLRLPTQLKQFVIDTLSGTLALGVKIPVANPRLGWPFYPQLCAKTKFDPTKCIIEEKLDGIRVTAHRIYGGVKLFSRNNKRIRSESVESWMLRFPIGTILDGEICGIKSNDMQSMSGKRDAAIYKVFDILMYNNAIIWNTPVEERIALLDSLTQTYEIPRPNRYMFKTYEDIVKFLELEPIEGVVAKPYGQLYTVAERVWFKLKLVKEMTVRVVGWTPGTGRLKDTLGSVEVASYDENIVATSVGSGFNDSSREIMRKRLEEGKQTLIEVEYQQKTADNSLRFPIFKCIRDDLPWNISTS